MRSCHTIFEDSQKSTTSTGPSCLGQQRLFSKGELARNDESKYKSNRMKTFGQSGLAQKTSSSAGTSLCWSNFRSSHSSHPKLHFISKSPVTLGCNCFEPFPDRSFIVIIWKKPWGPAAPHQRLRVKQSKTGFYQNCMKGKLAGNSTGPFLNSPETT